MEQKEDKSQDKIPSLSEVAKMIEDKQQEIAHMRDNILEAEMSIKNLKKLLKRMVGRS